MDWTFRVVLVPYPPSKWTELSCCTHTICSKCKLFVDVLGLFSAQIDVHVYKCTACVLLRAGR